LNSAADIPLVINGWTIFAHPIFIEQLEELIKEVERLYHKNPNGYSKKSPTKQLAAINKLAFDVIPQDPARKEFRQGSALGDKNKHWFRAKFFQQYRLFFRYQRESKIIVYAWVNNANSKRAYGSKKDAYLVFRRMIEKGHPPDDWKTLLKEARLGSKRFQDFGKTR
jgi:toxin YhaV